MMPRNIIPAFTSVSPDMCSCLRGKTSAAVCRKIISLLFTEPLTHKAVADLIKQIFEKVTVLDVLKLTAMVFMIGVATARWEYKSDQNFTRIEHMIEKHLDRDVADKELIGVRYAELNE